MRLSFLKHLLNSVVALVEPNRIIVLGSSSLLAHIPSLGGPGQPLEMSLDADFLVEPMDEATANVIKEAMGRESLFEQRFGYYADLLRPDIAETFPAGWESRLHPMSGYDNVFALDPYDLAIVKLVVGRPKDLELLHALLRLGLLEAEKLQQHYHQTPLGEQEMFDAGRNLTLVLRETGGE